MKKFLILFFAILFAFGCAGPDDVVDFVEDVADDISDEFDDDDDEEEQMELSEMASEGAEEESEEMTSSDTPSEEAEVESELVEAEVVPTNSESQISETDTVFFIPDNCANPPTEISSNDGFRCIASRTRNDSIVCLLPFQFTWFPLEPFTDDAGFTFGCNANDEFFDEVRIILTNGEEIQLTEAGCFNFVATADGPIGRQHWRNEDIQFNSVDGQLDLMVMTRDGLDTCLRF